MKKEHFVLVIPGLGDDVAPMRFAVQHWQKHGLTPYVYGVGWRNGEDFVPKLQRLLKLVDQQLAKGNIVSLVGTSAGGGAALNVFLERKHHIHKVVNICGRLRVGPESGFYSFAKNTSTSPTFAQSIKLFAGREHELTSKDKLKILTMHAWGFDELVPVSTSTISGAANLLVPVPGHVLSISMSLTLLSRPLLKFLTK